MALPKLERIIACVLVGGMALSYAGNASAQVRSQPTAMEASIMGLSNLKREAKSNKNPASQSSSDNKEQKKS